MPKQQRLSSITSFLILFLFLAGMTPRAECGIYKMMAEAMMHHMMGSLSDGWESKGVTLGIKSKGMTAIIPIPLPVPVFSRDKGGGDSKGDKGGGGGGKEKIKYVPIPVPTGGKESDWW